MTNEELDTVIDALNQGAKCLLECLEEIQDWRDCARYDPCMEGPRFKGWDRSALDRCRKKYVEPVCPPKTPT